MDLENQLNSHAASAPAPRPHAGSEISGMSDDGGNFNMSSMLLWISAVLAIAGTVFLFFLNSSAAQSLQSKKDDLANTDKTINSSKYVEVQNKSVAFQASVTQLQAARKNRYMMSDFLPLLYGKINKDVVATNVTVGDDGTFSIDGKTGSYRAAAVQLATLQSWQINSVNVIKDAQLTSESETLNGGVLVKFTISGTIDTTTPLKITGSNNTTTGGN